MISYVRYDFGHLEELVFTQLSVPGAMKTYRMWYDSVFDCNTISAIRLRFVGLCSVLFSIFKSEVGS